MKIQLPNGQERHLDDNINIEEKIEVARNLVKEFDVEIYLHWKDNQVRYFLDSLANYLVWHKENREKGKRGEEDKEVLSRKKMEKLIRYKKTSHEINFSDLYDSQKELLFGDSRGADNE